MDRVIIDDSSLMAQKLHKFVHALIASKRLQSKCNLKKINYLVFKSMSRG